MENIRDADAKARLEKMTAESIARTGLAREANNLWQGLFYITSPNQLSLLQPLIHYAEYLIKKYENEPEYAKHILTTSSPEKVTAHDRLIDEFNGNRENMIKDQDFAKIRTYYDQAMTLFESEL